MDMKTLPKRFREVLLQVEENCKDGELQEVIVMQFDSDQVAVIPVPTPDLSEFIALKTPPLIVEDMEKDAKYMSIRVALEELKPQSYFHIHESYATKFENARKKWGSVSRMPPEDRVDLAMVISYEKGKSPLACTAIINTHGDGTRSIEKWDVLSEIAGRGVVNIYE